MQEEEVVEVKAENKYSLKNPPNLQSQFLLEVEQRKVAKEEAKLKLIEDEKLANIKVKNTFKKKTILPNIRHCPGFGKIGTRSLPWSSGARLGCHYRAF